MNRQFPAFRGLAILFVLINHSIHMSLVIPQRFGHAAPGTIDSNILMAIEQIGIFAVPIFLFMSGAFLVFAIQNRPLRQAYKIVGATLVHTLAPYLLWSIIFYIMVYFVFGEQYTFAQYLKNILVGYPFNFVPLLVFFYAVSPFLIRLGRRFPLPLIALIIVLQLALFNILIPDALGFTFPAWVGKFAPPVLAKTLAVWGVFFPVGVLYNMYRQTLLITLNKMRWVLAALTMLFFVLSTLSEIQLIHFPIAGIFAPIFGMGLMPLIPRDRLPFARWLEGLGKHAYGLYLINLTLLTLFLYGFEKLAPVLLDHPLYTAPILFVLVLSIALLINNLMEHHPTPSARYVFG